MGTGHRRLSVVIAVLAVALGAWMAATSWLVLGPAGDPDLAFDGRELAFEAPAGGPSLAFDEGQPSIGAPSGRPGLAFDEWTVQDLEGLWVNRSAAPGAISRLALARQGDRWFAHAWAYCPQGECDRGEHPGAAPSDLSVSWADPYGAHRLYLRPAGPRRLIAVQVSEGGPPGSAPTTARHLLERVSEAPDEGR
jgi:hypothetical protein